MKIPSGWLVRFGSYDLSKWIAGYTIATPETSNSVTAGLYGVDGSIHNFGARRNPKGNILMTATCIIKGLENKPLEYQQELDEFNAMLNAGVQQLWYAPGGSDNQNTWRYTLAKIIGMPGDQGQNWSQTRQVTFSINDPFWYAPRTPSAWYFSGDVVLDGNRNFVAPYEVSISADPQTFTLTNNGNADALPVFVFDANSGTYGDFTLSRTVDSTVVESFSYGGTVQSGNAQLIVDCKNHTVTDIANFTPTPGQAVFMTIPPGSQSFSLTASTRTGTPKLYVYWEHTYHA